MTWLACPLVILCLGFPALPGGPATAEQALAEPGAHQQDTAGSDPAVKFSRDGAVLVYDTETGEDELEITNDDVDTLRALLRADDGITTLRLNSGGGSVWAAREMARVAMDFELDTEVDGECSSSCVRIFLGGTRRAMMRGSKIGFHSRHWAPAAAEAYYQDLREDEGWETPFDFASWIYRDTWAEAHEDLTWTISRGVEAEFAIEMHAPRDNMWFPTRDELRTAGVLRD